MSDENFRRSVMDFDLDPLPAEDDFPPAGGTGPSEGPLRVVPEGEATALLRIKLPTTPPVPSTALRSDSSLALEQVHESAAAMLAPTNSPARPNALPGDLVALTTATMVVPMPKALASPRAGQRSALLTASVPPDFASRAEADLLSDTVEQFFGDFDAIGRDLAASRGDGADFESPDFAAPTPSEDYSTTLAGRYGVPTQFPGYDAARRGPVGMRYLGGIFHDSSGESSFYDPETSALLPLSRSGFAEAAAEFAPRSSPASSAPTARAPVRPAPRPVPAQRPSSPYDEPESRQLPDKHWESHHPDHHRTRPTSPARRRAKVMTMSAVVGALLFGGVYGTALAVEGQVPRGTVVDGVAIGGMSQLAAESKLADALGPALSAPITLTADGTSFSLVPDQSGLTVDWAGTVAAASAGRSDPLVAVPAMFGVKRTTVLRTSIDRAVLRAALAKATAGFDRPMVDGGVTFPGGVPTPIAPKPGRSVDLDVAVGAVADAFGAGASNDAVGAPSAAGMPGGRFRLAAFTVSTPGSTSGSTSGSTVTTKTTATLAAASIIPPVILAVQDVAPTVTPAAVAQAMQNLARPAMSAPVTLVTGDVRTVLKPAVLGKYLSIVPDGHGALVPRVDGAGLRGEIDQSVLTKLEQPAVNAAFTVTAGKPVLVPGRPGTGYAPDTISADVIAVLTKPAAQRVAAVPAGPLPPALTTEAAQVLGISDVMGTYTEPFTASTARSANVRRAADLLRGQILQPGQTLSLNQVLGARTAADGFTPASGDTTGATDSGAGTSLVATALFNAEYLAGLHDVEHHPHSSLTDRFPAGMEAAVSWPEVDLKFQNDSGAPVYLWTSATDSSVTVAVLGQKTYDSVRSDVSQHYAIVQPKTVPGSGGTCVAQDAVPGFQIDVTRTLVKDGEPAVRQVFHTSYAPQNGVSCPSSNPSGSAAVGGVSAVQGASGNGSPPAASIPAVQAPATPTSGSSGGGVPVPPPSSPTSGGGLLGGLLGAPYSSSRH